MTVKEISFSEFHEKIEEGLHPLIFDVRNRDEAERSSVVDYFDLPYINLPYFEMLEESDSDDFEKVIDDYIHKHLDSKLDKEKPIVVVCAKVGTSEMIAKAFDRTGYDASFIRGGMTLWGKYYEAKTIVDEKELKVIQTIRLARGCLGYLCISKGEALVIDPSHHLDIYYDLVREHSATIKYVLDTHVHADHISGGRELAKETGATYLLHPYDGIHPIDMLPATFNYEFLTDESSISFGSAHLECHHIPGHTLGNMAYLVNGKYLFTGDSIFISSIARPDLGGKGETWAPIHYRSLRKLLELDDQILILPGHFSGQEELGKDRTFSATLGELREKNEDLKWALKSEEEFKQFILDNLPNFPKEYIEIKRVNLGLVSPTEEEAYELEVGKNLCALSHEEPKKEESHA